MGEGEGRGCGFRWECGELGGEKGILVGRGRGGREGIFFIILLSIDGDGMLDWNFLHIIQIRPKN